MLLTSHGHADITATQSTCTACVSSQSCILGGQRTCWGIVLAAAGCRRHAKALYQLHSAQVKPVWEHTSARNVQ